MAEPKSGFEPSEIFAATAMFFTSSYLDQIRKGDLFQVVEFFKETATHLTDKEGGVVFGSTAEKNAFVGYWDWPGKSTGNPFPESWQVTNMMQGISAALATKVWLGSKKKNPMPETVYMTGKKWPDAVEDFDIDVRGFASYNSSDIIIKPQGDANCYMGVSLKKKATPDSVDPTMINKAFDTVMGVAAWVKQTKEKIVDVRTEYFGKLVKEAVKEGHINISGTRAGRPAAWLFSGHGTEDRTIHNMHPKRAFIDTKGRMKMKEILGPKDFSDAEKQQYGNRIEDLYGLATEIKAELLQILASNPKQRIDARNIPQSNWNFYGDKALNKSTLKQAVARDSMRNWVNSKLGTDRTLYDAMLKEMNDKAQQFGEQLISVTLRSDVLDEIKKAPGVKRLGDYDFGFALVTGMGKAPTKLPAALKLDPKKRKQELEKQMAGIPMGKAYDIGCVLEGLAHLDTLNNGKKEYKFEVKQKEEDHVDDGPASYVVDKREDTGGPAKLIFDLIKNDIPVLAMELRFKGGFTGQPQFFGYMTKEFKEVLDGKCT